MGKNKEINKGQQEKKKAVKNKFKSQTVRTTVLLAAIVAIFLAILVEGICIIFKTYTITMDLGDGSDALVKTYNISSGDITLGIPEREGLRFTGWTGSNGSKPQRDVTIKNGSLGDLSYVANWSDDLTVSCQDWIIDKNGNIIREITSEVDKFLKAGKSAKKVSVQDRTITVKPGTKVNATRWGKDKGYKVYSDQYTYVGSSGDTTINNDGTIVYRYFNPILDVNYTVNGTRTSNLEMADTDIASFDLYVDGNIVAKEVDDYCGAVPYGSKYEVVLNSCNPEYVFDELSGTFGVMTDTREALELGFTSRGSGTIDVTCEDWVIDADGNKVREITSDVDKYLSAGNSSKKYPLVERTIFFNEGDIVSGANWGSSTSNGAYHDSYVYVSSSDEVTLSSSGVTVYRYFYPVLDINADVNGTRVGNTDNVARFNVYIDNRLTAENVTDFCSGIPSGSDFRIELSEYIDWSYVYVPSYSGSGTIGKYERDVELQFKKRDGDSYVRIEDWVVDKNNNRIAEITDKIDAFLSAGKSKKGYKQQSRVLKVDTGDTIDPALFGNDVSARAYEDGYVYAGASEEVTVDGENVTVYRYFYPVLDVNSIIDGEETKVNTTGIATFSVYVAGRLKEYKIEDYYGGVPSGAEWEVKRIDVEAGYETVSEEYSGIMGEEAESVSLEFITVQQ